MTTNNVLNVGLSGQTGTVHFTGSDSPTFTTLLNVVNLQLATNTISATNTNGNVNFQVNGTGIYKFNGTTSVSAALQLYENSSNGSNFVGLTVPATVSSSYTLTLPAAVPSTSGQTLTVTTGGVASWSGSAIVASNGLSFGNGTSSIQYYSEFQSYTPTFSFVNVGDLSVVYTNQQGFYSRIGNMVFVYLNLQFTPTYTTASGTGEFSLPFTVQHVTGLADGYTGEVHIGNANASFSAGYVWACSFFQSNFTYAVVRTFGSTETDQNFLASTALSSGTAQNITICGSFLV